MVIGFLFFFFVLIEILFQSSVFNIEDLKRMVWQAIKKNFKKRPGTLFTANTERTLRLDTPNNSSDCLQDICWSV